MLEKHEKDYVKNSWQTYSQVELQWWVDLLQKRATHRINPEKKAKDLYDANNYQKMLDVIRAVLRLGKQTCFKCLSPMDFEEVREKPICNSATYIFTCRNKDCPATKEIVICSKKGE